HGSARLTLHHPSMVLTNSRDEETMPAFAPTAPHTRRDPNTHKPRRPFGNPVADPKANMRFVPPPAPTKRNLVLPLNVVMPIATQAIEKAGRLVFHSFGDSGGIHGDDVQKMIADCMEAQIHGEPDEGKRAAFLFHLGDVVYFNGLSTDYDQQFYEPYKY